MPSISRRPRCLLLAALLIPLAAGAAAAQSPATPLRLHLVPQLGLAAQNVGPDYAFFAPDLAALTVGTQLELVGRSRWTPVVGVQHWWLRETCGSGVGCARQGWSGEVALVRSFLPTSSFRPFGGGGVGVRRIGDTATFLQGRAGIDYAPPGSPFVVRVEGRYQEFLASGVTPVLHLGTGIRFALPSP